MLFISFNVRKPKLCLLGACLSSPLDSKLHEEGEDYTCLIHHCSPSAILAPGTWVLKTYLWLNDWNILRSQLYLNPYQDILYIVLRYSILHTSNVITYDLLVVQFNQAVPTFLRHMKDQNKKVANLKHNQQLEKKKNAQLLEEVRRREDSMADNSQHLQVSPVFSLIPKDLEIDSLRNVLIAVGKHAQRW